MPVRSYSMSLKYILKFLVRLWELNRISGESIPLIKITKHSGFFGGLRSYVKGGERTLVIAKWETRVNIKTRTPTTDALALCLCSEYNTYRSFRTSGSWKGRYCRELLSAAWSDKESITPKVYYFEKSCSPTWQCKNTHGKTFPHYKIR